MAEAKTKRTGASVADFLKAKAGGDQLADCKAIAAMMTKATGKKAEMWGPSIVGFGTYSYMTGKVENTWPLAGFAPRGSEIVLYITPGLLADEKKLAKLGKHRHGKSCLYIKRLADVDTKVLESLIEECVARTRKKYSV